MINPDFELRSSYANNVNSSIFRWLSNFKPKTQEVYHIGADLSTSAGAFILILLGIFASAAYTKYAPHALAAGNEFSRIQKALPIINSVKC